MSLTEKQEKVLKGHLAKGEKIRNATADEDRALAVTDRRIIELEEWESQNRDKRRVRCTLLTGDRVIGTNVDHKGSRDFDKDGLLLGGGLSVAGILGIVWAVDGESLIITVGAALAALIGIAVLVDAFNTDDGGITVTVKTTEGDDKQVILAEGDAKIARSISESVGSAHGPK